MTISLISLLPSPYPPSLSIAVSCSSSAAPCPLQLQCLFACMWAWLWGRTNRVNGVKSEGVSSRRPPDNSASLALFISLAQLAAATTSLTHYLSADWYQYPPPPALVLIVFLSPSFLRHLDSSSNERPDISTIQRRVKVRSLITSVSMTAGDLSTRKASLPLPMFTVCLIQDLH